MMFGFRSFGKTNTVNGIGKLRHALEQADAVIIGAGAGLSTSAGFVYTGERFEKHFYDGIVADYPQTVWIDIQVDVTGIIIK